MDTQNTPIHIKLWHRDFWLMSMAGLLVTMSVYMLVPALPPHLLMSGFKGWQVGLVMGVLGLGIYMFGPFCSYLLQRYRRNRVCISSMIGMVVCMAGLYYADLLPTDRGRFEVLVALRFLLGACFGLAQMSLYSTLIIDSCESFLRTEANHSSVWFSRFALSLGPVGALLVSRLLGYRAVLVFAGCLSVVSFLLIGMVRFPFKAPDEHMRKVSLDRFFLPSAFPLFVGLAVFISIVGLLFSLPHVEEFYGMLMFGFFIALLAEKYAFADANLKSEIVAGLIALGAAVLITFTGEATALHWIRPVLVGFAVGIVGSRYLLFFIKLARHCQRGTSQSTFFLSWETGMSLGLFAGCTLAGRHVDMLALILVVLSLIAYNFLLHPWYIKHKNR